MDKKEVMNPKIILNWTENAGVWSAYDGNYSLRVERAKWCPDLIWDLSVSFKGKTIDDYEAFGPTKAKYEAEGIYLWHKNKKLTKHSGRV